MSIDYGTGYVPNVTAGDRLRMALRHADISVQEMADYLDMSRTSLSRWLNDRGEPGRAVLRLWALRCGVDVTWLATGKAPTEPSGPSGTPPGTRTLNPLVWSRPRAIAPIESDSQAVAA